MHGRIVLWTRDLAVAAPVAVALRSAGHLVVLVNTVEEWQQLLGDGAVPDVLVTDSASVGPEEAAAAMIQLRQRQPLARHVRLRAAGTTDPTVDATADRYDATDIVGACERALRELTEEFLRLRGRWAAEQARLDEQLRRAQWEAVEALALALEARDPYMRGHCERVAAWCRALGRRLQLGEADLERLEQAARVHEIGKLATPLELLQKPEALSAAELAAVRDHARVGAQILRALPSLRELAPLVETQYVDYRDLPAFFSPCEPVFLQASVLRVADTIDAMASPRAFRAAVPRREQICALRRGAGTRFHPDVVEAALALLELEEPASPVGASAAPTPRQRSAIPLAG